MEPPRVESEDSGLYLGEQKIAELTGNSVSFQLPPQTSNQVVLHLKTRIWKPSELIQGSQDHRLLGVQVSEIRMNAGQPGNKIFLANNGEWVEE